MVPASLTKFSSVKIFSFMLILIYFLFSPLCFAEEPIIIADFESEDYGAWQSEGDAFGEGPAEGTLPGQMEVTGFQGQRLVNSFNGGDEATGSLTSPQFEVKRPYISFLIGGGGYEGKTCINLLSGGEVVRTAEGTNTQAGGSEQLMWDSWNVRDLQGEMVKIQIVDSRTGGWGHINVDHIIQTSIERKVVHNKQREFEFTSKYLNFPVKNGAAKRWIRLYIYGEKVREFDIRLAPSDPDFWVYLDVSEFAGKTGTLEIDRYSTQWQTGFDAVFQAETFPGQDNLYQEKRRPQFHFTSRRGWVNDTNGMVYHNGKYHLFYQHNPYGWNWGNMTWGHAVSTDLVHWEEWGDAIHPDQMGTIFSGSAVVEHDKSSSAGSEDESKCFVGINSLANEKNSSGFRTGSEEPIVAFYTSAGNNSPWSRGVPFTQSIAYSNDGGRTFTKYEGNPIIGEIAGGTRDPKVFWHDSTGRWVMVLWIENDKFSIFTSDNLINWRIQSDIKGFFECPEMFELPVDGDPSNTKWVVYGAAGDYKLGDFNGTEFTPETGKIKFQHGKNFYASQTFNNIPDSDGRRIQMGWGRGIDMPDMPFNQMILFPVSLTLHTTEQGVRMFKNPVKEISKLHNRHWDWQSQEVSTGENPLSDVSGELFRIKAVLEPRGADKVEFVIRGTPVTYDVSSEQLTCLGSSAPVSLKNGKLTLEILADRMSIEIFAQNGRYYMPIGADLTENPKSLELCSEGGNAFVESMDVYTLKSIWTSE
ncbi:Levanase precursor [Sedimentisphaera cyanobacteriorum]|uniref:Levanase n=1 Tax=Sedimentisphaera cyanobacteriorum TaxID=1940790 RepID=A0A1Q2HS93_9BACT|nr:GH32 C-terminal domain-containing protein [Sedimentisphaera cyanobacteriorum]AQQ10327.1 Levanase precursor [Sedimentisphaera cyanobacteriorum]